MSATLRELADEFGCELHGDPGRVVARVGTLGAAGPDAVTFLANPLYRSQLAGTRAGAVILDAKERAGCPTACLVHRSLISPTPGSRLPESRARRRRGHPRERGGRVERAGRGSAEVGPHVTIGAGCKIGEGASIGAGSVLGKDVVIGAHTRLAARVTVLDGVRIGARCILHPGAVIGADGFGFAPDAGGAWVKIPQLGGVAIGDDVEIGANTTVDRGTIDDTVIENGVKLDNLVQIAHNVRVGEHTVIAAMVGIAGSTKIGKRCMIGGGVTMINQIEICDDVMLTFSSVVLRSIDEPGMYSGALPADEASKWRRNAVRFKKLDALAERVTEAERTLAALTGKKQKKRDD